MADPLRHRQTKGEATDMVDLTPPRHIPTLPSVDLKCTKYHRVESVDALDIAEGSESPLNQFMTDRAR